jgi:hypothetical protein
MFKGARTLLCVGFCSASLFVCEKGSNPAGPGSVVDTLVFRDTTYSLDTLYSIDTTYSFDTLFSLDTIVRIDTIIMYDSVVSVDSLFTFDTLFIFDTTHSYDTIHSYDTLYHYDTVTFFDTVVLATSTWDNVVDSLADASYMIALRLEASGDLLLVGSGCAIDSRTIITNAHVFGALLSQYIIYSQLQYAVTPVAVQNGWGARSIHSLPLDIGGIHQGYTDTTVFSPDIGYFKTSADMSHFIHVPPDDTLRMLRVGQQIATLGFPGEPQPRSRMGWSHLLRPSIPPRLRTHLTLLWYSTISTQHPALLAAQYSTSLDD